MGSRVLCWTLGSERNLEVLMTMLRWVIEQRQLYLARERASLFLADWKWVQHNDYRYNIIGRLYTVDSWREVMVDYGTPRDIRFILIIEGDWRTHGC